MYILYYLNQNLSYGTIEVETLNEPILIPENLIFTDLRKGINFIKEPHSCCDFTHLERLIMQTDFFDMETIKIADFRKANTFLTPKCVIDEIIDPVLGIFFIEESISFAKGEHQGLLELSAHSANMNIEFFVSETLDLNDFVSVGNLQYELRESEYHIYSLYAMPFETKRVYFLHKDTNTISRIFDAPAFEDWYEL